MMKSRTGKVFVAVIVAALAGINGLAFMQAWSMTRFAPSGAVAVSMNGLSAVQKAGILARGVVIPRPENRKNPGDFGMPYSTVRFPSGREGMLEGWVIPGSPGRPQVVMFHGYAASRESLLVSAKFIHSLGYPVLMVDFRGSGGSFGKSTSIGFHEARDVMSTVRFSLGLPGRGAPILFGRSMGAAAIMRAISDLGLATGPLILESPYDTLLHTVGNRFRMMGLPVFPGAELLTFWGGLQLGFNGFALNPAEYARVIHVPVLLMCGERDRRVTVPEVEKIYFNFAGRKTLKVFRGAGHEGFEKENAAEWSQTVRGFLAGRSG